MLIAETGYLEFIVIIIIIIIIIIKNEFYIGGTVALLLPDRHTVLVWSVSRLFHNMTLHENRKVVSSCQNNTIDEAELTVMSVFDFLARCRLVWLKSVGLNDQEVLGLTLTHCSVEYGPGQAAHMHVPRSPNCIISQFPNVFISFICICIPCHRQEY